MISVALYSRVSTQEQAMHGYSIDEQIDRMTKYCEAMNWTVFKNYTDAGFSGASTDRFALQRMISDIKDGKINKVLVYKLDRLSRSQKDTLELIEDVFLANDVDFVSMSENFDTATPFGRAMIGILAVFAQLEREQIKERMSMGRLARAKQGKYHGSRMIPIGYDYVDGELVVNEFEKHQIQSIFKWYSQGILVDKIVSMLNDKGLTHKYGKWTDVAVRRVLKRKTYLGYVVFKGNAYKGNHEAIISQELFDDVQLIMERKSAQHQKANRRGKVTSYLGGLLYCSHCGGKFSKITSTDRNKKKYRYYICNSRSKVCKSIIKDENCKNKRWRMEQLDSLIFDEIRKLALDPSRIPQEAEHENGASVIEAEIKKLDAQAEKFMDLYGVGSIPVEMLQARLQVIIEKKSKLADELEHLKEEEWSRLGRDDSLKMIQSFGDVLDRGNYDEIRSLITALIDRIDIDGEDITIHWNFV